MNCACRISSGKIWFCPEHFARLLRLPVDKAFLALQRAIAGDLASLSGDPS